MSGPSTRLELRQSQRLALSPTVQQSLGILALSGATLEETVAKAAAENPFLIYLPGNAAAVSPTATMSPYDVALQTVAANPSLGEHLCGQIALMDLPAEVTSAAMRLAYDLDESGFFTQAEILTLADEHGMPEAVARQAVRAVQACDPVGVGAFNLVESIRLQLVESGVSASRIQQVLAGLPYFSENRASQVGPALGLSPQETEEVTALVRSLDPAPGRAFDLAEPVARSPELVVSDSTSGGLTIELVNDSAPRLKLDTALAAASGKVVSEQLWEARTLLAALRYRGKTLLAVGNAVLEAQAGYFTGRSPALVPLTRSAIAERLGLHKSTVGRAISGKTLLWRGRMLEMEGLFPVALEALGKTTVSSHTAQLAISRLVAEESGDSVLSDDKIRTRLREDGVDISRRTVAKYRKCLNIPSSSTRRRLLTRSAKQHRAR